MGFQQELRNYDPASQGQWFDRLSEQDQKRYNALIYELQTNRYVPPSYRGASKRLNKTFRANADPLPLTDEQIYSIDKYMVRTYYDANIMERILAPVMVGQTNPRWQSKIYKQIGDDWPGFTSGPEGAFRNLPHLSISTEVTDMVNGFGFGISWNLEFTLVDQGGAGLFNPDSWHSSRAAITMGKVATESLLHGTGGEHSAEISEDTGIDGFWSDVGISTVTNIDGTNDDLTDNNTDIEDMFTTLLADVVDEYEPGRTVFLSTSGIATEALLQESANTDRTMYERIQKKFFDSGLVNAWYVVNELDSTAGFPSNTDGQCILLRLHPSVMKVETIYPLQKKPRIGLKEYADDVAYTLLKAWILKIYNKAAIVKNDSTGITSTSAGIIRNGLFMTGSGATPHQMPLNPTDLTVY